MKPEIPRTAFPGLYLLGLLNAVKAAAMVLFADGLASSVIAAINGADLRGPLLLAAAATVLRSAMVWAVQLLAKRIALGAKERLRAELTQHWVTRGGADGGAPVLATRGLDALDGYYGQYLPALVSAATVPLLIGLRILAADWVSALTVVLTVPLVPIFMALIGWFTQDKVSDATGSLLRLSAQLAELARGLPVLIGLRRAREQRAALDQLGEDYRQNTMVTLRIAFLSALALELIATLSVALVAVFIGLRLVYGQLDLGTGLLVLILVADCYLPLRELGTAFHASDDGREAMRRAKAELASAPRHRLQGNSAEARTDPSDPEIGIRIDGLSVRYLDRSVAAIKDVSFTVPAGALWAISGPSGCGKSTVLGVLAGTVTSAEAELAGRVEGIDPERLAWLPQEPGSTESTVAAELELWGAIDPGALLHRVGLAGRGEQHPASLSPGQLRRLALARVLAKVAQGARIVLVDEPTAHVDQVSARLIESALQSLRGQTTVLLVSHDPAVLALADGQLELGLPEDSGAYAASRIGNGGSALLAPSWSGKAAKVNQERAAELSASSEQSSTSEKISTPHQSTGPKSQQRRATLLKLGWHVLQPWRPDFLGSVFFGLLAALAGLALAALSGWLIVRASQQPPVLYLLTAIVGVRFFGLLRAIARYVERLLTHNTVFAAANRLRGRLWDALARTLPARRELRRGDAVLSQLIGEVDTLRDLAPRVLLPPFTALLAAGAVLLSTFLLFREAAALQVAVLLAALLICPLFAVWADRRAATREQSERAGFLGRLTVLLGAAEELRTNRVEAPLLAQLAVQDRRATLAAQRGAWAEGLALGALTFVCCLGAAGMVLLGAPLLGSGQLPAEVLVAVVLLQLALIDVFVPLLRAAPGLPLLVRMVRGIGSQLAVSAVPSIPEAAPGITVRADRLAIGWQGTEVGVGIDFALRPGDWLTVSGPSGAGKSTLLATLMGFTPPLSGTVAVTGQLAWCPQEAHLFDSTLRGNLVLARPKASPPTESELRQVLAEVGLAKWLDGLPLGLETRIGKAGSSVSGGQRQRIAVARALLTPAQTVLLDEPTAHLDTGSAQTLMSDLRRSLAQKTVILVTHRSADTATDDEVLVLAAADRDNVAV